MMMILEAPRCDACLNCKIPTLRPAEFHAETSDYMVMKYSIIWICEEEDCEGDSQ